MASKLGARKDGSFKAISTAPSFNKTPVGASTPPLPYPTVQDLSNAVSPVSSVRFNSKPAYVLNQTTQPSCKGDNAGVAKGVKSGTLNGEVKPTKGSTTVRVGGQPVIREGDPCTMNGGNNPGLYVTVPAVGGLVAAAGALPNAKAETEPEKGFFDRAAEKIKEAGQYYKDNISDPLHGFAGDAMDTGGTIAAAGGATAAVGGGMALTGIGAAPGAVVAAAGGATSAVGGGVAGVGGITESVATGLDAAADFVTTGRVPNFVALGTAYAERMVMSKIDKVTSLIPGKKRKRKEKDEGDRKDKKETAPASGNNGFKVEGSGSDGGCGIKPYKDQTCPPGQQAHHIVPDYALRYGSRGKGAKGIDRIPGMPSLDDGPSICLSGGSKEVGGDHNLAHEGTDPKVKGLGDRLDKGPLGVAPIGDIIEISIEEVGKVKPHCKEEIKNKVDDAFKNVDRKTYGRTTQNPPKKDTEAHGTLSSGKTHQDSGTTRDRSATPRRKK
jgi:hypothetical protein